MTFEELLKLIANFTDTQLKQQVIVLDHMDNVFTIDSIIIDKESNMLLHGVKLRGDIRE